MVLIVVDTVQLTYIEHHYKPCQGATFNTICYFFYSLKMAFFAILVTQKGCMYIALVSNKI